MNREAVVNEINRRNEYLSTKFVVMNKEVLDVVAELTEVITMAEGIGYYEGQFKAYSTLAGHYIDKSAAQEAMEAISNGIRLIDQGLVEAKYYANIYNKLLIYYGSVEENYEKANEYYRLGLMYADAHHDIKNKMFLKNNFAVNNLRIGHYNVALELLEEVLPYYEGVNEMHSLLFLYDNFGSAYLGLHNIELSQYYYLKAKELAYTLDDAAMIKDTSIGIAKIYTEEGQYDLATEILKQAQEYNEKCNNLRIEIELIIACSEVNYVGGRIDECLRQIGRLRDQIDEIRNDSIRLKYEELAYLANKKKENYQEALVALEKYRFYQRKLAQKRGDNNNYDILQAEYQKNIDRLKAVAEIGRNITMHLSLEDVLTEILSALKKILSIDIIGIGKIVEDEIAYDHFVVDQVLVKPFRRSLHSSDNLSTWCVKNRKEIFINNLSEEFAYYSEKLDLIKVSTNEKTPQSVMYTPLIYKEEVVGVFTIQSYLKFSYSSEEYEIFKIISSYITVAIINSYQAQTLIDKSITDDLTGLLNRKGFNVYADKIFSEQRNEKSSCGFVIFDLDSFKNINDVYGHVAGDQVLSTLGKVLKQMPKNALHVSRMGGEEFSFFVIDENYLEVHQLAEMIRQAIEAMEVQFDEEVIKVTTSIGVAYTESKEFMELTKLYKAADDMLYIAKSSGKNCVKYQLLQ